MFAVVVVGVVVEGDVGSVGAVGAAAAVPVLDAVEGAVEELVPGVGVFGSCVGVEVGTDPGRTERAEFFVERAVGVLAGWDRFVELVAVTQPVGPVDEQGPLLGGLVAVERRPVHRSLRYRGVFGQSFQ